MQIKIDFTKTAQENADDYYKKAKRLVQKKAGAQKAVIALQERLEKEKNKAPKAAAERKVITNEPKEWYEKFHWFFTSDNKLVVGGRDAHQNELINSKHFNDNDLFFHANIFGASVTVMIDGKSESHEIREEVAQFAACNSSAWKDNLRTVDVYAMDRDQVSKSKAKGSLGTGSFLLSGERDWYRDMTLMLVMFVKDNKLHTVPMLTFSRMEITTKHVSITQGKEKKSDAAKKIAKLLDYNDIDTLMQQLPAGEFRVQ